MARYKDFDKFYSEHKRENLIFKIFNEQYNLPPSIPAKLMLLIMRNDKKEEVSSNAVVDILEGMLGKKQFKKLCDKGMDIEQMEDILKWASEAYGNKVSRQFEGEQENFTIEK